MTTNVYGPGPGSLFSKPVAPPTTTSRETPGEAEAKRQSTQRDLVWAVVKGGQWMTPREVAAACEHPLWSDAAVTARLRDFRKPQYGGHRVDCRQRPGMPRGVMEYRVFTDGGNA